MELQLQEMVYKHDKHIDRLDLSFTMIADNLKDNNVKLDKLIEVVENQRIFTTELNNLRDNTSDSIKRGFKRLDAVEIVQKDQISPTIIKWILAIIISYTVSFCVYTDQTLHKIDKQCTKMEQQITK